MSYHLSKRGFKMKTVRPTWGNVEWPLFTQENANKCPTARYVGGISRWLCECRLPRECNGIKAVKHG